jgi:uncharacterized lipoprotein YbaY
MFFMVTGGCYHRCREAPLWVSLLVFFGLWLIPLAQSQPLQSRSADSPQQPASPTPSPNPQAPPAQQTFSPPAIKRPPIRSLLVRHTYQCAGGVQVVAIVDTDAIHLTLNGNGKAYELKKAAVDGGNLKYSSGSIVWSSNVQTGMLEDESNPANPTILARDCQLQSASELRLRGDSISGTLNFATPKELPPTAEIRVALLDLKPSDELHKQLGETTFKILDQKAPIPFELKFDPQKIRSQDCCALYAEIRVDDKPQYATSGPQPIANMTQPGPVNLELVPVHKKTARP